MSQNEEPQEDISLALFELSEMPQFGAILELLRRVAADYHAPMPKKGEDVTAYNTSNFVSNTIREVMQGLQVEVSIGRRIATTEHSRGDTDADTRDNQRRRV